MNGFERRKEQSKERIRSAALELFKLYGFEQVTISHISRKADVSQVTIYNHFGSKEELVREAVKMIIHSLLEKHRAILDGEGTFMEKLEFIIFDRFEMLKLYQGELIQVVTQGDYKTQKMIEVVQQQELDRLVIALFNMGKSEGYIKQEVSEETILAYYEILRRGIITCSRLTGSEQGTKLMSNLTYLFLHGLIEKKKEGSVA